MATVRHFLIGQRVSQTRQFVAFALKHLPARAAGTSASAAVAKEANAVQDKTKPKDSGAPNEKGVTTKKEATETHETSASVVNVEKNAVPETDSAEGISKHSERLPLHKDAPAPMPATDEAWVASEKIQRLVEQIASLSILEVADLNKALKRRLNLPDAPLMTHGFVASTGKPAHEPTDAGEKTEVQNAAGKSFFSVKLTQFDAAKKIALIKEVRSLVQGLNLVQAKKFVESLPAVVKEDLSKKEAEELKAKLEKIGGVCEIV